MSLFFILLFFGCRGDSQTLATYQDKKVTRGMLRDIAHWYQQEQGAKNILWQKFTVKQIALINILSKKAEKAALHKTLEVKKFEIFNHSKILYQLYLDNWREEQERIPEALYETESIMIHKVPPSRQRSHQRETLLKYAVELKEQITGGRKNMSELVKIITKEKGRAEYIVPEYRPMALMEDVYKAEIMQMLEDGSKNSLMISKPIRAGPGWQIIQLKKVSFALKDDLFDYLRRPRDEKQLSILLNSYWERILSDRTKNWKKTVFQKYGLDADRPPELPKDWQNHEFVFQNSKISLSKKDFLIFVDTIRKLLKDTPDHSIPDKDQYFFKDFLETNIFIQEARKQGLHNSKELRKIFDWERKGFLSKEYMETNWFGNIRVNNAKLQRFYQEQKKESQKNLLSRETLKKSLLSSEKRKILEQNMSTILREHGFVFLDDEFEQDFL